MEHLDIQHTCVRCAKYHDACIVCFEADMVLLHCTHRCDKCSKWRRVPAGAKIDLKQNFHCSMILGLSCKVKEENWEQPQEWDGEMDRERKVMKTSCDRHERGEKRRHTADVQEEERKKERRATRCVVRASELQFVLHVCIPCNLVHAKMKVAHGKH
jgi:hypothetical protein